MTRAFRAKVLTPLAGSADLLYLEDGVVTLDGERIARVAAYDERIDAGALDLRPSVLVPGFVDTHVHFPQTRIVGSATGPLLEWLERTVFPEEARFRDEAYARVVASELVDKMIARGTTLAAFFSSSSEDATRVLFEELERRGTRAVAGLVLMDQLCPEALRVPAREAIAATERLVAAFHRKDRGRLEVAVTPRFALSCSREMLEAAGAVARAHDLIVQTHVAENDLECRDVLASHPYARDYVDVYDRAGLVGARTLLAHGIHLSAREVDCLRDKGARVAHCPDSNFFLGSGRMRLAELEERGVRVGLGSDVAAGRSLDMRRAIAHAYDTSLCVGRPVSPERLFRMATLGGAEVLGMGDVTGSLEVGKEADLVLLSLPAYVTARAAVLAAVAFGDDARALRVLVRGKELLGPL